jgi:hypothetical protein
MILDMRQWVGLASPYASLAPKHPTPDGTALGTALRLRQQQRGSDAPGWTKEKPVRLYSGNSYGQQAAAVAVRRGRVGHQRPADRIDQYRDAVDAFAGALLVRVDVAGWILAHRHVRGVPAH